MYNTKKELIEDHAEFLAGGRELKLCDAWDVYIKTPKRKQPGMKQLAAKLSYWNDFVEFASNEYDIETVNKITFEIASCYINRIQDNGRYVKKIS